MPKINLQPSLETTKHESEGSQVNLLDAKQKKWYKNPKSWIKLFFLVGIIVVIVLAIVYRKETADVFNAFIDWFEKNLFWGAFAFMAIYWIATVAFIPGSILTLGAGFVFTGAVGIPGALIATLVVWLGAALGATTAFILGKFVFRDSVEGFKEKSDKFDLIDKVVSLNGFKVTLLLRLSPIVPFNFFNYFMGLTGVSFRAYNFAHIGMIPGTMAYCFIGGLGGAGASGGFDNPVVIIVAVVGTVIAIIGMVAVGIYGKKQFSRLAAELEENKAKEAETKETAKLDDMETIDTNDNGEMPKNSDIENQNTNDNDTPNDE